MGTFPSGNIQLNSATHGQYRTTPEALDKMMEKYLPASVNNLQVILRQVSGDPEYTVDSITEGLMILAEYNGYATN